MNSSSIDGLVNFAMLDCVALDQMVPNGFVRNFRRYILSLKRNVIVRMAINVWLFVGKEISMPLKNVFSAHLLHRGQGLKERDSGIW